MATAFDHIVSAPARHKRKGIPMRSPCQRDMVEAPGVVFRFPDKINTGLNILPSSAGLPSGHGAKSAAAVIAAAAAISASSSPSSETSNINAGISQSHPSVLSATTSIPATTAELPATTITSTKTTSQVINPEGLSLDSSATSATSATAATPILASVEISSTTSTPILKPASALPIHRSASNVLHYPELLSDLRDKLMQVHQGASPANNASSGVESDDNRVVSHHAIKRTRVKRASRSVVGSGSSPGPSGSGHGTRGSSVLRTTLRSRHELGAAAAAAAAASATGTGALAASVSSPSSASKSNGDAAGAGFHRRHSIGTIHSQQVDGDDSDIVVDDDDDDGGSSSGSAKAVSSSAKNRHSPGRRLPRDGQVATAAARRHLPKGSGEADAGAPKSSPSAKRKRDAKDGILADHQRGGSPAVKRPAVGHHGSSNQQQQQQHQHAHGHATGGGVVKELVGSPFAGASSRRCCASCGASSTPCWRPGLIDSMTLCNQCGLRYKKGKVYCVKCSYVPTKTEIATGGATVCKRCLSHIRTLPSAATHNVVIMQPSRIPPSGSASATSGHSDSRRVILPAPQAAQQQQQPQPQQQPKPAQSSGGRPGF
ncbi:DNA-binding transcription repressor [Coemansia erecta]|uniref:DNA-binding transcription repressor n=1 Tax=Coemansia erecta TaxID=147472 RepID=A0A9W7Y1N6_9FUNG|nr:DNA-binding transcription repressor [Coemansia erecta]